MKGLEIARAGYPFARSAPLRLFRARAFDSPRCAIARGAVFPRRSAALELDPVGVPYTRGAVLHLSFSPPGKVWQTLLAAGFGRLLRLGFGTDNSNVLRQYPARSHSAAVAQRHRLLLKFVAAINDPFYRPPGRLRMEAMAQSL